MDTYYNLKHVYFDPETIHENNTEVTYERQLIASYLSQDSFLYPLVYPTIQELILIIGLDNNKLKLQFTDNNQLNTYFIISFSPYIRLIREYKDICSNYKHALLNDNAASIETIDMARRGLHNQAADLIQERLIDKLTGNYNAFRHLFTLMTLLVNTK